LISDWLIALFAPAVIGRSNYFGVYFTAVIPKPLYLPFSTKLSIFAPETVISLMYESWVRKAHPNLARLLDM